MALSKMRIAAGEIDKTNTEEILQTVRMADFGGMWLRPARFVYLVAMTIKPILQATMINIGIKPKIILITKAQIFHSVCSLCKPDGSHVNSIGI